ncbi:MAG: PEP-CTERM sorting domain-containing protein [Phenylobacterium sp.]|nr:MAG: PEP-CTERM sorting domain-containing protein [Phenylobacterium sp.]
MASSALAGTATDADLASPGVYYGTGNSNGHFTVDTEGGVEVALRAHVYQQDATSPVGDLYSFNLGDVLSFDYSVNPDVGASPVTLSDSLGDATITIHDFANNNTQSFPADFFLLGNATNAGDPGGYQNSERLSFGFVDSLYNPAQNNTFSVNFTLSNVPDVGTISVTELIQQGAGFAVPEPASWALMILGFGGTGAALRRRRQGAILVA